MTSHAVDLVARARAAVPEAALPTGDFDGVEALLSEALRLDEAGRARSWSAQRSPPAHKSAAVQLMHSPAPFSRGAEWIS